MTGEPPHFIITGRCPSHKNTYRPVLVGAFKFKTLQSLAHYLLNYKGPRGRTVIGTLSRIFRFCIGKEDEWLDWEKQAREAVGRQLNGRRIEGWVHVKVLYYPPNQQRVDFDAIIVGALDILQDKIRNKKIGPDKRLRVVEYPGIYPDDKYVNNCDGSRLMLPDPKNPRLEIWVWPYTPGPGEFRG